MVLNGTGWGSTGGMYAVMHGTPVTRVATNQIPGHIAYDTLRMVRYA
jgi:hypothetical protein